MGKKRHAIHRGLNRYWDMREVISDDKFFKRLEETLDAGLQAMLELKYCPYGPFVEQSPIMPAIRSEAIEHNEYLRPASRQAGWKHATAGR